MEITINDVREWWIAAQLNQKPRREYKLFKYCPHLKKVISFSSSILEPCECSICLYDLLKI